MTTYKATAHFRCKCGASLRLELAEWEAAADLDDAADIESESHGWQKGECPDCARHLRLVRALENDEDE